MPRSFRTVWVIAWLIIACGGAQGAVLQRDDQVMTDRVEIGRADAGLADVIKYVRENPKLFTEPRRDLLTLEEKQQILNTWKRFLDYQIALESIGRNYRNYSKLPGQVGADAFYTGHAAATVQYRYALEFLHLLSNNGSVAKLLNEEVADLGLGRGTLDKFKFRFLNTGRGLEFAAREMVYSSYNRKYSAPMKAAMEPHTKAIWQMGKGRGQVMTFKNAVNIVRKFGFTAWLPVQTAVSEWMGDTKVYRINRSLVSPQQIAGMRLEPGDILLERRDWYLSNVGLPGFWPHSALYIGTAAERDQYFTAAEVQQWVRSQGEPSGNFNQLLDKSYKQACARCNQFENGKPRRVIEAISEGVVFTTLEHSADADSVAVLRPKLDKVAKAVAIYRAFGYAGRPYDFNFDFDTDASLVCTELVSKAYEPNEASPGLKLPIQTMLGRKVTPANEIVRQFDEQHGKPEEQMTLVLFLDANEKTRRALIRDVQAFRASWKRPKWHVLTSN